ncbi:MAG TPA: hypothetical protein VLU73_12780 [Methylococcaceae bacterium]|jgi:hypothetical protein|nr:hypothetical protein [Methylococcaceae bacterium]
MTLGLDLDGSGFRRRSETFAGNVADGRTLVGMLQYPRAPSGALSPKNLERAIPGGIAYR